MAQYLYFKKNVLAFLVRSRVDKCVGFLPRRLGINIQLAMSSIITQATFKHCQVIRYREIFIFLFKKIKRTLEIDVKSFALKKYRIIVYLRLPRHERSANPSTSMFNLNVKYNKIHLPLTRSPALKGT